MNQGIKAKWVAALRSDLYVQITGRLADTGNGRCCLGVLCDLAVEAGVVRRETGPEEDTVIYASTVTATDRSYGVLPDAVVEWAGLPGSNPIIPELYFSLAGLNDDRMPFGEIAEHIERGTLR